MNRTALRLISITAAVALTSLGTMSVAQAKQGADDTTPQASSSAPATSGHGADDAVPHVSGADDAVPHVSGADDAVPHVSGADDRVTASASSTVTKVASSHRHGKGKGKRGSGHRGAHHTTPEHTATHA